MYFALEGQQPEDTRQQYESLWFPGCCASTDCIQVPWNKCPEGERHLYFSHY